MVNLDMFEEMVSKYRLLWLSGRYGGGKTSLAVYLAARFCQAGLCDKIVSNTPLRLAEWGRLDPKDVHDVTDCVLLMDESWRYVGVDASKEVKAWMAYMRKRNQILLMPSVMDIAKALRVVRIERRFNFTGFGLPMWWYTWFLNSATGKEKQQWFLWHPKRVFDLYDHSQPEMDDFVVYRWAAPELPQLEAVVDDSAIADTSASSGVRSVSPSNADEHTGIEVVQGNVAHHFGVHRTDRSGGAVSIFHKLQSNRKR